jgi:hypothetical protein
MLRRALLLTLGLLVLGVVWLWSATSVPAQVPTSPPLSPNQAALDPFDPQAGPPDPMGVGPWLWRPGNRPTTSGPGSFGPGLTGLSATPVITFDITYGSVAGYTDPNSDVRLLLWDGAVQAGEARTRSDAVGYFSAELMADGYWAQVQPGDNLAMVVNGTTTALDLVPALTGTVDPVADTVSGSVGGVPLPASLLVDAWGNRLTVTTDGSGNYSADLSGLIDVSWLQDVKVSYQETNGNWLTATFYPQNGLSIVTGYSAVFGYTEPGATVTVTVDHSGDVSSGTGQADPRDGWWYVHFDAISAGDVVTAELGGVEVTDTASALTAALDLPNDQVTGSGPADSEVSVYSYRREGLRWWYANRVVATDASGNYTAGFAAGELDTWSSPYLLHHDTAQADTLVYILSPLANVEWTWNGVWGYAEPGASITASLSDGSVLLEEVTTTASPYDYYYWAEFTTPFQVGYQVQVVGGGLGATVDLATVTLEHDLAADALTGQAPPNAALLASTGDRNGFGLHFRDFASADAGGAYLVDVSGILDLHNGRYGHVYAQQDSDVDQPGWQRDYDYAPYIDLSETYNGLSGYVPEEKVPVTITLETGGGAVKGITYTQSDSYGFFDWQQFHDGGDVIDIQPGDRVVAEIAGWSQTVVVPAITVKVEPVTDRVTGTGPANSFVEVHVRGFWPWLRVPTDGDGHFLADFTKLVDIVPGREAEVAVYDENWNRQYAVGELPDARARIYLPLLIKSDTP